MLPSEKQAANGTALRSFSPQDIADIGFAAPYSVIVLTKRTYDEWFLSGDLA